MLLRSLYIVMVAMSFFAMQACSTSSNSSAAPSSAFTKAKYLTELTYITKDKGLVKRWRQAFVSGQTNREEFRVLNNWVKGKDRATILETIELHLNSEFVGL